MPTQWFEQPTIPLSYEELTDWAVKTASQEGTDVIQYLNYVNNTYPDADLTDFMIDQTSNYLHYIENGDGTYTVLGYETPYQSTVSNNPINSNSSQISRGRFSQVVNHGVETVGDTVKRHMTTFPSSGSFAERASYVLGSAGYAIEAVSAGVTLGKIVDSALYNANPDYWNSIGLPTLNPETWNSITNGSDSPFAGLFNMILGLDPDTGNGQMYMDENALAYMAYALKQNGWFDVSDVDKATLEDTSMLSFNVPQPVIFYSTVHNYQYYESFYNGAPYTIAMNCKLLDANNNDVSNNYYVVTFINPSSIRYYSYLIEKNPISYSMYSLRLQCDIVTISSGSTTTRTYTRYFTRFSDGSISTMASSDYSSNNSYNNYNTSTVNLSDSANGGFVADVWYIIKNGNVTTGGVEGVSNQPNATLPDVSSWNDIPSTLQSLQTQYPDLWNDALTWDNLQPDGTVVQNRYVPVAMPSATYNNDTQPVSSSATQTQTQLNPDTSDETLLKLITDLVTATKTQTQPELEIPPSNPVDTGYGNSPTPIPPTGSASALWAVYHPTQAQVNDFGAWLWSTNFVDQLLKVFQNPMDAIISLHKVFIMPVDAGNTTIHAGYLDSGVSSAYITQQYVYADCGSVNCFEYFGTVFDYVGTNVSLYLPFIGIVPLNVNEVMRSTIKVKYGCDLFTGAILVEVTISRDGNNVIMYQYGGDGGVQYPVSGSRSSGFLTGLAATIGAAASVATGGAGLPAFAAAFGGSVMSAQKQVQHSGGFSGNSGAMGCKIPYLIIERPQTKVASLMPSLDGFPTNYSIKLSDCSGQVVVSSVHIEGINATENELKEIEKLLKAGILV